MNNDLISRSALKEKVDSVQYTKEFCIEHQIDYSISMQMLGLVIDNAPTIEINEITQDLIDKVNVNVGLAQPIKDERPQGEWIDNKVAFYHVCSECGACVTEVLYKIFLCEGELNYCPNCGADMRGDVQNE